MQITVASDRDVSSSRLEVSLYDASPDGYCGQNTP